MTKPTFDKLNLLAIQYSCLAKRARSSAKMFEVFNPKLASKLELIGSHANGVSNSIDEIVMILDDSPITDADLDALLATLTPEEREKFLESLLKILKYIPFPFVVEQLFELI